MTSLRRTPAGRPRSVARGLLRVFLAVVFLYAGTSKLLQPPQSFADSVASFRLLPPVLVVPVGLAIPPFEWLLGLSLLSGWPHRLGSWGAFALTAVFLLAMIQAFFRGLPVDCGCFGAGPGLLPLTTAQKVWFDLARDLVLTILSLTLYRLELAATRPEPSA